MSFLIIDLIVVFSLSTKRNAPKNAQKRNRRFNSTWHWTHADTLSLRNWLKWIQWQSGLQSNWSIWRGI